jgi:DNA-binding Xre family transcriptional regulator
VLSTNIVLTFNNTFCYTEGVEKVSCTVYFPEEGVAVTISCKLRLLVARVNVERAQEGKEPLSLRRLAAESGVSLSALAALNTGKSQRIDYTTIDQLLTYFNSYFQVTTSDLLVWEREPGTGEQFVEACG